MSKQTITPAEALDTAIYRAGGLTALGKMCGAIRQSVAQWRANGVPIDRVAQIERGTGVKAELLRPDVDWLRTKGKLTHYRVAV